MNNNLYFINHKFIKINKDKLILIALTSLEISAKIEEVQIVKLNEYIQ